MKHWIIITLLMPTLSYAKPVRTLTIDESDVPLVHTAPGFSTMLEFEGRPTSAVVGDQDAFKVEYVGTSVTIKPVVPGAKTNLFVFVDYERFNFTLHSGAKKDADYIVRVKTKRRKEAPPILVEGSEIPRATNLTERPIRRTRARGNLVLTVRSVAAPQSHSSLIVYFKIACRKTPCESLIPLDRARVNLSQGARPIPIESVYLDLPALFKDYTTASGTLIVREEILSKHQPLTLKFLTNESDHFLDLSVNFCPYSKTKGK